MITFPLLCVFVLSIQILCVCFHVFVCARILSADLLFHVTVNPFSATCTLLCSPEW